MKSNGVALDPKEDLLLARYTHLPSCVNRILYGEFINDWIMQHEERTALIYLLSKLTPECAIEIGTAEGGSLSVIAKYSNKVYSLDINPACDFSKEFSNVDFVTGRSQETLPPLLKRLQSEGINLEFVLIDGDHTGEGVKRDIENILQYKPARPLYIVMHDSFNPECRRGMTEARWDASPYVHFVELDFVSGRFEPDCRMTCGFALALMLPVERRDELIIHRDKKLLFQNIMRHSVHSRTPLQRSISRMKRIMNRYRELPGYAVVSDLFKKRS
jgi:hypothetical protein